MLLDEKETKLTISGLSGPLESVLSRGDSDAAFSSQEFLAIICHPHPQQGGTMDNKVVTTLLRTYRSLGVHALRFNFRGVGNSGGTFGKMTGELDDLLSVINWVKENLPDYSLLLAGFSFGSSIAARASYSVENLKHLTLIAPPVERYEYDRDGEFNAPLCVVQGDLDERVNANGVYEWVDQLKSPVTLIRYPESTHFFHGFLTNLKTDLTEKLLNQLSPLSH